jgi:DNA-directed RNA polymerase subunit H (RpoH/RPB5)
MAQSLYIEQIYKSRNNLLDILGTQNYDISPYENASLNEVNIMESTKQLDMMLSTNDNEKNKKKCYVKYHLDKNLRTNIIYEMIEDLFNLEQLLTKKDDLIIIVADEPNDPLIKTLKDIWQQEGIYITVFNIKRLQFNILKHELVPKHTILNKEETEAIRKKYNIMDDSQIPDISRFSPVSLAIGIRPGEICEITRPSKTAINSKFYRICSP